MEKFVGTVAGTPVGNRWLYRVRKRLNKQHINNIRFYFRHFCTLVPQLSSQFVKKTLMSAISAKDASERLKDASFVYPLVFVLFLLVVWEVSVEEMGIAQVVLPQPSAIIGQMVVDFSIQFSAAQTSFYFIVASFIIGSTIGILFAVALSLSASLQYAAQPILVMTFVIPKVVLAPVFFVWFGATWEYFLLVPVLLVFFPVMENTLEGLKTVPEGFDNLSKSVNATLAFKFRHVRLPYALPHTVAGLKIGMRQAVVGVIVAEFIAPEQGLGELIIIGTEIGQPLVSFGAILSIIVIGLGLYSIIELVDRKVVFWTSRGEGQ